MRGEDYRKARDAAADAGTLAHWLIECHLRGDTPDLDGFAPDTVAAAENAYLKWLGWWDTGGYRVLESEVQLVHETERYGGTLDIVAMRPGGGAVLIDLKTGKGIYPEMWRQVAAYGELYEESCPAMSIDVFIICRIGRTAEDGDFEVQERQDLSRQLATFRAALALYQAVKSER